jgi:pyrrolidone-carboxylate peptidase
MELHALEIDVGASTDPGLYVCNDLFYSIVRATREETRAGFVHLPRIFSPTEEDVTELRAVVEAVVRQTAALHTAG